MSDLARADPLPVTAVVVARNRGSVIGRCLASLETSGITAIVVVDGCSSDDTASIAEARGATVVSDRGAGLAVARNIGAETATTEWVMYVDSDAVVEPETAGRLLAEALDLGFDAVQARLDPVERELSYWQRGELWRRRRRERAGPARTIGCQATLVRRRLVLDVRFDALFTGAGEDGDFFARAGIAGGRLAFSSTAVAHHDDRRTLRGFLGQRVWHGRGLARTALRQRRSYGVAARDEGASAGAGVLSEPGYAPFMLVSLWGLGVGFAIELISLSGDRPRRQRLRDAGR
jgi:glycosyltransferase involved in cell wall biosynthesis